MYERGTRSGMKKRRECDNERKQENKVWGEGGEGDKTS
jgi:hypothetical protein